MDMPKEKINRELPSSFASFGKDLKEVRTILKLSRSALAEMLHMDDRYLANIENSGYILSLMLFHDLATAVNMPVERYFNPNKDKLESKEHERLKLKPAYCPKKYLPVVEAIISEAIKMDEADAE